MSTIQKRLRKLSHRLELAGPIHYPTQSEIRIPEEAANIIDEFIVLIEEAIETPTEFETDWNLHARLALAKAKGES